MKITFVNEPGKEGVMAAGKGRKSVLAAGILVLLTLAIGFLGGLLAIVYLSNQPGDNSNLNLQTTKTEKLVLEESSAVTEAVDKASRVVVSISSTRDVRDFFGQIYQQEGGVGTGFVITQDGMIVTNNHVVAEEATYTVFTSDGKEYAAKILARDAVMDLAILKVEASGLPVVDLGSSKDLKVGQWVIAIGNALGQLDNTVTVGVISAKERQIMAGSSSSLVTENLEGMLQTDAAINPGNSGGPLVNLKGQVVGVNTAVAGNGAQNIGFAIPIDSVKNTIDQVKQFGRVRRPYLGVRYIPITREIAQLNNLKVDYGALVLRGSSRLELAVLPGSPADKAGVQENDIILEIGGEKITAERSLARIISDREVGDQVELKILRGGKEQILKATLEELTE